MGGLGRGIPSTSWTRTQDTMPGPCPGQPGGPLSQVVIPLLQCAPHFPLTTTTRTPKAASSSPSDQKRHQT